MSRLALLGALIASAQGAYAAPHVLQVGTFQGHHGKYASVQDAVKAASPGDWILIGPGDYHESPNADSGVWITTRGIHLRGMNRNSVVIDGTLPGAARCSADPALQNLGAGSSGRNGIQVYKVGGVTIENLTVCNFIGLNYPSPGA